MPDARIETTHTGSLPRVPAILDLLKRRESGEEIAGEVFDQAATAAVQEVVRRQVEAGITVVNDGEQSKTGYADYVRDRITGFEEGYGAPRPVSPYASEFIDASAAAGGERREGRGYGMWVGTGPLEWKNFEAVEKDIRNLKAAAAEFGAGTPFMTAASPATFANHNPNVYYAADPDEFLSKPSPQNRHKYIEAISGLMEREYEAIAAAGIMLQLDCPDLGASRWTFFANLSDDEFLKLAEFHIEALNHATRRIPRSLKRMHVCWGAGEAPHNHDVPLEALAPILVKAEVGAISFVAANGRHLHEWKVWRDVRVPDGIKLIPGVIDSTTNIVEHPEWVADRILQYASVVGAENLMAGVDCGFGPIARANLGVNPMVVWEKLRSLGEGARIASARV
ncbi:MAG TPA: cobalamin-independent methionine synthase II family protein [Dehalococcoidia bacterium]|nr:cobalamin-independent methionine synthase II family protein [Dehalococcoidia bacterium]